MENEIAGALTQSDFGLIALFMRASLTVKIVMIILLLASVKGWSVVIAKYLDFRDLRKSLDVFLAKFWSGEPLETIAQSIDGDNASPSERIFLAGLKEFRKSHSKDGQLIFGAQERIERAMDIEIHALRSELEDTLGALATIGSTAPFIGLFGTVWGIKNSFQDIALSGSTNLAVVAPGIAEALVATALGLVAAIPAVIFYNKFQREVEILNGKHASFAEEFAVLISRQIGQKHAQGSSKEQF